MYLRWAERHGYKTEVFDTSYAEEAGIKSATFRVAAPYAYGTLSVEQGTHRLVRISPVRQPGPPPDVLRRGRGAARRRGDRPHRDPRERPPGRRVPLVRPGRAERQHHRLRGAAHAHPDRHRRVLPEREVAAAEQGGRDAGDAGQAAGAGPQGAAGRARRAQGRRLRQLGQPDALLRAAPVPDGQGPAHRARGRQHRRRSSTATSTTSSRPASAGARQAEKAAERPRLRPADGPVGGRPERPTRTFRLCPGSSQGAGRRLGSP